MLATFRERDHLNFPLVSDPDRSVLTAYGAYGEKRNYGRTVLGVNGGDLVEVRRLEMPAIPGGMAQGPA